MIDGTLSSVLTSWSSLCACKAILAKDNPEAELVGRDDVTELLNDAVACVDVSDDLQNAVETINTWVDNY